MTAKKAKFKAPNKRNVWLKHYLNQANPDTFLNAVASAKAAGYKASTPSSFESIGYENLRKLRNEVETWLDDNALSTSALKEKLLSLIEAKQTKFIKIKGAVSAKNLPAGCELITTAGAVFETKDGMIFGEGESLLAINTDSIETQRRSLDMALKIRGAYAPDEVKVSGLENLADKIQMARARIKK